MATGLTMFGQGEKERERERKREGKRDAQSPTERYDSLRLHAAYCFA